MKTPTKLPAMKKPAMVAVRICEDCYGADPECPHCHGKGEIPTGGPIIRDETIYDEDGVAIGREVAEAPCAPGETAEAWKEIVEISKRHDR